MTKIKRYITFTIVLFLLIYSIQYSIDWLYKSRCNDKVSLLMQHKIDDDVMVFGSSVAYVHFDPAIIQSVTNLSTYNMGWDGTYFIQYNGLIKEYLSYEKKCKYLVITCDFDNLQQPELISRLDLFMPYLSNDNIYNALHAIERGKIFKAKYIPGYKLTLLNAAFYKHLYFNADRNNHNGYEPRQSTWEGKEVKPFNASISPDIYTVFKNTVNEIEKKDIKVIFVIPPVYTEGYKLILNADTIKQKYTSLVNNNTFFLDYTTDSLCNQQKYFYNYSHLNAYGAAIFSKEFATDLLKITKQ